MNNPDQPSYIHRLLAFVCSFLLITFAGQAQLAAWQFGSPAAGGDEITYTATTLDADLAPGTALSRGAGVLPTTLARAFSANDWTPGADQATAIANDDYFELTLGAATGFQASLTSLDCRLRRSSSGPNAYIWRYSLDGSTFHDIGSAISFTSTASNGVDQATVDLSSVAALQAVEAGTDIILRLYAWGSSSTGGTFAFGRFGSGATDNSLAIGGQTGAGSGSPNTAVQFAAAASSTAENAGTTDLMLSISDPDAVNATTITLTATGATSRIATYTTEVIFPANSATDEPVTVTVDNNSLCDGDEDITFSITAISGGQGTAFIGIADSHTLTVLDDETTMDPVTTAGTAIGSGGFTANWDAVNGATGYFLDVSTSPEFGTSAPGFSTTETFTGIGGTPGSYLTRSWTGADGVGWTAYKARTDQEVFPGNEALALQNATGAYLESDAIADGVAAISFDVMQVFSGSGGVLSVSVLSGPGFATSTPVGTIAYTTTASVFSEAFPAITGPIMIRVDNNTSARPAIDNLTFTRADGSIPSFVPGYENLPVAGLSQAVTGLDPLTTYYYRVRSEGGCSSGVNSNVTEMTTLAGVNPVLDAGELADFGALCLGTESAPQSLVLEGFNLTADDVAIAALDGFTFATAEAGPYTASLNMAQPGGSFMQEVWVKFSPALAQAHDGNLLVGGGGAPTIQVAVTGSGINTPATMATGEALSVTTSQAEVEGTITEAGCSALSEYGIEYSTTEGFTPGTGTQAASTNAADGAYSSVLTGLDACTVYYYIAYGTNAGGTEYGEEGSFETDPMPGPVATLPATVEMAGFTATWDAVDGAAGYRLDVSTSPTFGTAITVSDLLISEYVEGSANHKYIELYNGTSASVDLSDYALQLFANGSAVPNYSDTLAGTLASGATVVYAHASASTYSGDVVVSGAVNYNGNDAVALRNLATGSYADIFGRIGENPGAAWTASGGMTTVNKTLVRKPSVSAGITTNPASGFPTLETEWTMHDQDATDHLGAHDLDTLAPDYVPGYENLAVAGTSHPVTGLDASTTYYYRVRAEAGNCASAHSNVVSVTTLACPGNAFIVAIHTDDHGGEISWALLDENDSYVAFGGPYTGQDNTLITESVCIGEAPVSSCYQFHLYDSFGDGLSGTGYWQLLTTDGGLLLGDDFADGYESPSSSPLNPNYSNHSICLPAGPGNIAPTECGIFNNALGNKVYANKVAGASNYQFEFTDPDAGFIRRIARPYNYVHFWDMVSTPLVPGVKYFARVRTDRDGPMQQAHFGTGCEMGIGLPQVVTCSELIQAPAYGHSCNETRAFNTNNSFIWAKPVVGATEYQFRIFNTEEGYDQTFIRSTYILQLKWNSTVAPPLINGYTYQVEVNVKVNGLYSGFCASSCTITIDNSGNLVSNPEASMALTFGDAQLWPNPVRDGQVNLSLDGLAGVEQTILVDVQDIYGKQVFAKEYGNRGERFSTVLELGSEVASGVYLVGITVNGERTVQRLSVMR